jgi:predicted transporter
MSWTVKIVLLVIVAFLVISAFAIASTIFHILEIAVLIGIGIYLFRSAKKAKSKLSEHKKVRSQAKMERKAARK